MTKDLHVALRLSSQERGHLGSSESRELCISDFLEEAVSVVCEEVLASMSKDSLAAYYENWLRASQQGADSQARREHLVEAVKVVPRLVLSTPAQKAEPLSTSNVVSLRG